MAADKGAIPNLEELLKRLDDKGDDKGTLSSYTGRALSKSGKNLHLSTHSGVIAIPLANIENITPLSFGDKSIVTVDVQSASTVTRLTEGDPGDISATASALYSARATMARRRGPIILTGDTDTITGGRPDACDDTIVVVNW